MNTDEKLFKSQLQRDLTRAEQLNGEDGIQDTIRQYLKNYSDHMHPWIQDVADQYMIDISDLKEQSMNLKEQYIRLFKNKPLHNDTKLLKEASFTDSMTDEQKELYRLGITWIDTNDIMTNNAHSQMADYIESLTDDPRSRRKVINALAWAITYRQNQER